MASTGSKQHPSLCTALTGRALAPFGMPELGLITTTGGVADVRPYLRSFGRRRQRPRT